MSVVLDDGEDWRKIVFIFSIHVVKTNMELSDTPPSKMVETEKLYIEALSS